MASVQALQVFRQSCRAQTTFTSRWAVRRTIPLAAGRHYSAEATEPSAETKQSETKGEKSAETPPNPLEEKLKAKENEVADLTVRILRIFFDRPELTNTPFPESTTLSPSRFLEPAAECSAREGADA